MSMVAMLLELPCGSTQKDTYFSISKSFTLCTDKNKEYKDLRVKLCKHFAVLKKEPVVCFIIITRSFWRPPSGPVVCVFNPQTTPASVWSWTLIRVALASVYLYMCILYVPVHTHLFSWQHRLIQRCNQFPLSLDQAKYACSKLRVLNFSCPVLFFSPFTLKFHLELESFYHCNTIQIYGYNVKIFLAVSILDVFTEGKQILVEMQYVMYSDLKERLCVRSDKKFHSLKYVRSVFSPTASSSMWENSHILRKQIKHEV